MSVHTNDVMHYGYRRRKIKVCRIAGCSLNHWTRGFCKKHHARWVRNGDFKLRRKPKGSNG